MPYFNSPVNIHVHSRRHRLCDPDGASVKAVLDQIVKSRILEDDSAEFIKEIRYSQEKISIQEPETTTITITETACKPDYIRIAEECGL